MKKVRRGLRKEPEINLEEHYGFYFIAGFTSGGLPFGTTMEEAEELGWLEGDNTKSAKADSKDWLKVNKNTTIAADDLPF